MTTSAMNLPPTLIERLEEPGIADALVRLLDRLDTLNRALDTVQRVADLAEQAPKFIAMAVDSADEVVRHGAMAGIDIEKGVIQGTAAALRFGATMGPEKVQALEALLESEVLDPPALRVIGQLAGALSAAARTTTRPMGPLGLLKALAHPDMQRALGFLSDVGKHLGQRLRESDSTPLDARGERR
jgi:uncharacterized protein YjgD (DUF1641 family)